ncbi:potassium channel subfamily K member 18-like [Branchiostoma lanceolatum]|uniref:potassium channel subfamily K member 18-like n=1 Tax=Branchiostoma lanceolatum TaxID=7740 RepID=UPI0034515C25
MSAKLEQTDVNESRFGAMNGRNIGRNNVAKLDTPVRAARPNAKARNGDVDGSIVGDRSLSLEDQRAFAVRQCLKPVLSHVGIVALLLVYCFVGAAIFQAIESPREIEEQQELIKSRDYVIEMLWNNSQAMDQENWTRLAVFEIGKFAHSLDTAFHHGVTPGAAEKWTYYGSLFFAATVVSTIGYGHHAPVTPAGRVVCILYALVGIPLYLFCVADMGLLLARAMTRLFSIVGYQLWRFERDRRNQKFKDHRGDSPSRESNTLSNTSANSNRTELTTCSPRDSPKLSTSEKEKTSSSSPLGKTTSIDSEEITPSGAQSSTSSGLPETKTESDRSKGETPASNDARSCRTAQSEKNRKGGAVLADQNMDVISLDDDVEELNSDIDNRHCAAEDANNTSQIKMSTLVSLNRGTQGIGLHPSLTQRSRDPRLTIFTGTPVGTEDMEGAAEEKNIRHRFAERKIDVPLSVVVLLFLLYNVLCALVIKQWEGWDFLTAFYFSFITLSTIGFGDVFPEHQKNLLGFSVMILFGMAVLTMCISLAQNQTYKTVQRSLAKFKALTKRTSKTEGDPEQVSHA